ncbi:MAG: hypothetical protein J5851_04215 [Oscillospiraceae bacterium]|nr:hypothetical protein [Oscillospiraceae bacterium]
MDLERIAGNAGNIIRMFNHVFATENGFDAQRGLLFASGLAGYACHQAVKASGGKFVVVETDAHKKFYMGDDVNKYLLEDKYSVLSFCNGFFEQTAKGEEAPAVVPLIRRAASVIGDKEYRIWNVFPPEYVYTEIGNCWDGIYENMTSKYCESPEEWPILFGIVLQNMMMIAAKVIKPEEAFRLSMECALFVSKMDDDSI